MKICGILTYLVCVNMVVFAQKYQCLPSNVTEDSIVSASPTTSPAGGMLVKTVTVSETLKKLKARCSRGKLVDSKRRPITFYMLQGCWGNAPADGREILEQQKLELAKLKKKFTVIEMTCNPGGLPPQSIG